MFLRLSNEITDPLDPMAPVDDSTPIGEKFYVVPGISFATMPPSLLQRQPRRYSLYSELIGSPETLRSDATFLRLRTDGEWVHTIAPRWRVRLRGQVGITWSDNFDSVPTSYRFFAGGDNSVRGFGLNELSPLNAQGARVGGPYLLFGSVELERDLPKIFGIENLGVAAFFDAGNAFDNFRDFEIENSVGVGARYRLVGIASIGVDIAQALSQKDRSPRFHLSLNTLL
jgi:translocation and assembly module TamA